jgi:hypothetical protein
MWQNIHTGEIISDYQYRKLPNDKKRKWRSISQDTLISTISEIIVDDDGIWGNPSWSDTPSHQSNTFDFGGGDFGGGGAGGSWSDSSYSDSGGYSGGDSGGCDGGGGGGD